MVKHHDVHVQLTGTDGNTLALLGRCTRALKKAGYKEAADELTEAVFNAGSYDEALALMAATVDAS